MCPEPSSVSGNSGVPASSQPEVSAEELQKRFKELTVEQQNAALQYALNGGNSAPAPANPAAPATNTPANPLTGQFMPGSTPDMNTIFGGSSMSVDQQKLNEVTQQMLDFSMKSVALPFGLSSVVMQNSIGQFFQSIMSCFKFEPLKLPTLPAAPAAPANPPANNPANNPADNSANPPANNPANNPAANPAANPANNPANNPTKPTKPSATNTTSSVSQNDSDYATYGNGKIYKKKGDNSNRYVKHNGQWTKIDGWADNGMYRIGNKWCSSNGVYLPDKGDGKSINERAVAAGFKVAAGGTYYTKETDAWIKGADGRGTRAVDCYRFNPVSNSMEKVDHIDNNGNYRIGKITYNKNGEKISSFTFNKGTSFQPAVGVPSVSTIAADYGNGNRILRSSSNENLDSDALFEISGKRYYLKLDDGGLFDTTLDYYDITHQRTSFTNGYTHSFIDSNGQMSPNATMFQGHVGGINYKKIYFEGKGEFDGCEVKKIVDSSGAQRLGICQNGTWYDLNSLMSTKQKVKISTK